MNAYSRFLTLHALARDHTFAIDPYLKHTVDWSRSAKDGHAYANKAPGAVLVAAPFYLLVDRLVTAVRGPANDGEAELPEYFRKTATVFVVQVIPCALLSIVLANGLVASGVPFAGIVFFLLVILFGNTSAFFFNSFFGHGLAALFLLGGLWAHWRKRFFLSGLSLGFALLTDYTSGFLILVFALPILASRWREIRSLTWEWKHLAWFLAGGILPGLLWIWYHTRFFGSPFSLPISQESPSFVAAQPERTGLLRVIGLLPSREAFVGLLIGPIRGILFTQPWVFPALLVLPLLAKRRPVLSPLAWGVALSCLGLFYLNASFPLWQGGATPGPRYLCLAFPLLALVLALGWSELGRSWKVLLWAGLAVACAFRVLAATGSILAPPEESLWPYYWQGLLELRRGSEAKKLLVILVGMGGVALWYRWGGSVYQSCCGWWASGRKA